VNGSSNPRNLREKIVTIDDPVSAMDSSGLSIVASIASDMVSACEKGLDKGWNADKAHIKQLFILTHNISFYSKVTDGQSGMENCVSFYLVQKGEGNVSSIEPCNVPSVEDIEKSK
jgi:wobble nucleotide-excising tRNase